VTVLNRGVGGDRVADLRRRWSGDCLDLKPNVVSVLIGINDTWRRYDSGEITTIASYEADYRYVLDRLRATSDSQLVLVEPFLLSVLPDQEGWRADLDPRIRAVSALAAEYEAVIVRADLAFQRAAESLGVAELASDGVHPTELGHRLLAAEWLTAVGLGA
jgi:lysophospholipase L1-like esterase